jgi:hypothetical protein
MQGVKNVTYFKSKQTAVNNNSIEDNKAICVGNVSE